MHPDYDLLIFDWDGTLCDSIGRIVESMRDAAIGCGLVVPDDDAIKGIIGLGLPEAIRTLYPDIEPGLLLDLRQRYSEAYTALDAVPSALYDGVAESLSAFRQAGYRMAVATGKSRRGLDRVLAAHGWQAYFDITRAADETASKPDPLMLRQILEHCDVPARRALMVGDSAFDLQMAINAGMDSVAVGYGAQPLAALSAFGARRAIGHFSELRQWLAAGQDGASSVSE